MDEITPFFAAATSFNLYAPAALILSPTVVPAESVVSAYVPLLPIKNLVWELPASYKPILLDDPLLLR